MKPAKNNVMPDAKKNQVNEKSLAPSIQTFFKSVPKPNIVDKNVAKSKDNGVKQFYVDILKEKIRNVRDKQNVTEAENGKNEICHPNDAVVTDKEDYNSVRVHKTDCLISSDVQELKSSTECTGCAQKAVEIEEWERKYKDEVAKSSKMKKIYLNQVIRFSELDAKYDALLKATTSANRQTVDNEAISDDGIFTQNEVKFLQCMSLEKKSDCTFIHHCLKYAYKLDPSVLVMKTLKGVPEWTEITDNGEVHHDAKASLTPTKVERIKSLFVERITKREMDADEYAERIKDSYVNKLIGAGIKNISKKYK